MKEFFAEVRKSFGPLTAKQVEGIETLVAAVKDISRRHQAYVLATAWHETAATMQPIEEYGKGKGRAYGKIDPATGHAYYGRGYVQLTWKDNYVKATRRMRELRFIGPEIDFARDPTLVMVPNIAAKIIVIGMSEGWFTGKRMSDFDSYVNMRRVVNGTDKAELIAGYAEKFERALGMIKEEPVVPPDIITPAEPPKEVEKNVAAWVIGALLAAFAAFGAWMIGGN